ncbi:MAG: hypothetical protein KAS32_09125 [Candidatus Peribacteraceae bacterium]|nr:hypothetical protein [Candidatus Peribacteraceae bacterium]
MSVKIPCSVFSRVTGYITEVSRWNEGKVQEFSERKEFKI